MPVVTAQGEENIGSGEGRELQLLPHHRVEGEESEELKYGMFRNDTFELIKAY